MKLEFGYKEFKKIVKNKVKPIALDMVMIFKFVYDVL
jgi:hypothetical protein